MRWGHLEDADVSGILVAGTEGAANWAVPVRPDRDHQDEATMTSIADQSAHDAYITRLTRMFENQPGYLERRRQAMEEYGKPLTPRADRPSIADGYKTWKKKAIAVGIQFIDAVPQRMSIWYEGEAEARWHHDPLEGLKCLGDRVEKGQWDNVAEELATYGAFYEAAVEDRGDADSLMLLRRLRESIQKRLELGEESSSAQPDGTSHPVNFLDGLKHLGDWAEHDRWDYVADMLAHWGCFFEAAAESLDDEVTRTENLALLRRLRDGIQKRRELVGTVPTSSAQPGGSGTSSGTTG